MAAATEVIEASPILASKINELVNGTTAPVVPVTGQTWVDTSASGAPVAKVYTGSVYKSYKAFGNPVLVYENIAGASLTSTVADTTIVSITGISVAYTHTMLLTFNVQTTNTNTCNLGLAINGITVNSTAQNFAVVGASYSTCYELWIPGNNSQTFTIGWGLGRQASGASNLGSGRSIGTTNAIGAGSYTSMALTGAWNVSGTPALYVYNVRLWDLT